jgi:phosphoglycolate phosphatase-like HAD superfamily hydrolase
MSEAPRRLVLWDVDGTLLSAGPAARVAFDEAVAAVVGREAAGHGVQMSGKTDPEIALDILATLALEETDARVHLPAVLEALERRLESASDQMRRDGRAMAGAEEVLERLSRIPEVLQSVLTGNLEPNGRLKLRLFGLDRWLDLDVGAYGSDHHDRDRLVPIALEKVERARGVRLDPGDVWIVGDTPRDLDCARAGGARCLLVATGRIELAELERLGADAVLPDLTDADRVIELLAGGPGIDSGRP